MIFHDIFGNHAADPHANHWENGHFVSACQTCGRPMVKPPGENWKLAPARPAR